MSTTLKHNLATNPPASAKPPFLRRVRIRGYKSIAFCDVTLEPLTILVGRNASGKSNFVDALAFLHDVARFNLSEAINRRGGMKSLLCQTVESDRFSIQIESIHHHVPSIQDYSVEYHLDISARSDDWPYQANELFRMTRLPYTDARGFNAEERAARQLGPNPVLRRSETTLESPDLLMLTSSAQPYLDTHFGHGFQRMGLYNFLPDLLRRPQKPTQGGLLERDGRNLASIIRASDEWAVQRASRYLAGITPSVEFAGVDQVADYEALRFRVTRQAGTSPMKFFAASMSDGTLRAFAALMAAFQSVRRIVTPTLVALEEPETSLHPAAMHALVDALDEATLRTQILLTTHSVELLDNPAIKPENIRVVEMVDGQTVVGPVDEASAKIVAQKLGTLGSLERENQLQPKDESLEQP